MNGEIFSPGLGLPEIWHTERKRVLEESRKGPKSSPRMVTSTSSSSAPVQKSSNTQIRQLGNDSSRSSGAKPEPLLTEVKTKPKQETAGPGTSSSTTKRHFLAAVNDDDFDLLDDLIAGVALASKGVLAVNGSPPAALCMASLPFFGVCLRGLREWSRRART